MAEVRVIESMAIVVPVFDHEGLEFPKDFIPCEPKYAYGYLVYAWNKETGQFGVADSDFYETLDEAVKVAQALHLTICEREEIFP